MTEETYDERQFSSADAVAVQGIADVTGLPESTEFRISEAAHVSARIREGDGPAVLLLHGSGTGSGSFWAQFNALGRPFELIAWDAFGFGGSSDPSDPARLDDFADALAVLLDARGRRDAHVVGNSWGGLVATRFALRHPERVRTLALLSSTPGQRNNATFCAAVDDRIAALALNGVRAWMEAGVARLLSPGASQELRQRVVAIAVEAVRLQGFTATTQTLASADHRAQLGQVRAATLVMCGDQDPVLGPSESRLLADGIPGAEFVLVQGGGHMLNQEKPEAVNAALLRHWHEFDIREGEGEQA